MFKPCVQTGSRVAPASCRRFAAAVRGTSSLASKISSLSSGWVRRARSRISTYTSSCLPQGASRKTKRADFSAQPLPSPVSLTSFLPRRRQLPYFSLFVRLSWSDRKISVSARLATVCRQPHKPPHKRKRRLHSIRRDSLHFLIPADRAMRPQRLSQRHDSRVKSPVTVLAPPRVHSECT